MLLIYRDDFSWLAVFELKFVEFIIDLYDKDGSKFFSLSFLDFFDLDF